MQLNIRAWTKEQQLKVRGRGRFDLTERYLTFDRIPSIITAKSLGKTFHRKGAYQYLKYLLLSRAHQKKS